MADFYQSKSISTLHRLRRGRLSALESELSQFSRQTGIGLILPALISEFERPAMRRIVDQLRDVRYYSNIVVAVGRATRSQVEEVSDWFQDFCSPVTILWIEDPNVQAVFRELERAGMPARVDGKGRTCWLSMGYLLAAGHSDVIALHDCDIVDYSREIPASLCYPLAHPRMDFDFCKGYYARTSGKLHGRVTRLFVAPFVEALREHLPESKFLSFLSEFRYPLAGEFALKANLARKIRMPSDWGLEVGVLSEVFQHAGASRVCQADIADNYEHKHQDLSPTDSSKGLRRMTFEIAGALFRCLERHGMRISEDSLRRVMNDYAQQAGSKVLQYEADALMNGLLYDRSEEIRAVTSFGDSLEEAVALRGQNTSALPSWDAVERDAPHIMRQLLACPFVATEAERAGVSRWLKPIQKPAMLAQTP
jgi:glucosyl-3-phosphoglycerate synthase